MEVDIVIQDGALEPRYESSGASGMDTTAHKYALVTDPKTSIELPEAGFILEPCKRILIKTGISVAIPDGYEIQVRPRSGLALKAGITVLNTPGTIDSDYRGEIGVLLINTSDEAFVVKKGDRIAQLVLAKFEIIDWHKVDILDVTARNEGGYGHTGKK